MTLKPGCYVDGALGIYAVDDIVQFARDHGAKIIRDCDCDHGACCFESEFAACDWAGEYEDQATDYMEDHFKVDMCYWGRNENGDWGLWPEEGTEE